MTRGRLIVFEGLDGAGTTTQLELVTGLLGDAGVPAYATANPSDGPLGVVARDFLSVRVPLSERVMAMVFSGDRLDHYERVIVPRLDAGEWVICDRYYLSTLTYQAVGMSDLPESPADSDWVRVDQNMAWVMELNRHVQAPDLTISFEVEQAERQRRMGGSAGHQERYDLGEAADRLDASYTHAIKFLEARGDQFLRVQDGGSADEIAANITSQLVERWPR